MEHSERSPINFAARRKMRRNHHEPESQASQCTIPMMRMLLKSNIMIRSILLVSLILAQSLAAADWIDPDTPFDQRTSRSYTPKAYTPPREKEKPLKRDHTASPTETLYPTYAPTVSPTPYPTVSDREFDLVFSDEFNTPGRTFEDGADPRWTAMNKNDYTNDALHYYSSQNAVTNEKGELVITTEAIDTAVIGYDDVTRKNTHVTKHFKSAMLQGWNKFCFTGGIIEAEVILPGKHDVGGLWPAFWMLGNLARHTYVGSSEHVWPWSATTCTEKSFNSQLMSGCDEVAHYGMERGVGRGSPEVDIFEVQPGKVRAGTGPYKDSPVGQPFMSSSFQVAPGRPDKRPGPGWWPGPNQWYEGLKGGNRSALNINFYGNYNHFPGDPDPEKSDYWSDAISYNRQLEAKHFDSRHVYRLEWDVPSDTSDGYLNWFLDGELILSINGTGVKNAGTGSEISSEPSYLIMNTAVSSQWGFPKDCPDNCQCKKYDCNSKDYGQRCGFADGFCDMMKASEPPEYKVNWVRVYQDPNEELQKVGCSTPERPTRRFIKAHENLYKLASDEQPLKDVQDGRGWCNPRATSNVSRASCGGLERGRCTQGKVCECSDGWTGHYCLSRRGSDPILYDLPDHISDVGFIPPQVAPMGLLVGFLVIFFGALLIMWNKKSMEGWTPIPDVEYSKSGRKKDEY